MKLILSWSYPLGRNEVIVCTYSPSWDSSVAMFWLVLSATASSVLLLWLHWRWSHRRMLELAASVPGPFAWPLVGNSLTFMSDGDKSREVYSLDKSVKVSRSIGKNIATYLRFWLGPDLNICVKNPADIRVLLTSNKVNQKGPAYDFMKNFIGPGILTGGPTWRNHRKIATPAYNKKCVNKFSEVFNKEAVYLADVLAKKDSTPFDVYYDVVKTTTQCVCQTLMGLSKEDSMNLSRLDKVVADTSSYYTLIFNKMTRWWLQVPLVYWWTGGMEKERRCIKDIDALTSDIVRKRRQSIEKHGLPDEETMGIVDRFILSGELTEQEVKWETFSLFTTSQEAAAKITSGLILFLAHLPEWQDKVYNEIVRVVGVEGPISADELKQLEYLDMVYKETLRYWSIAAMIQRTVEDEVTINNGTITLPVGTSLVIPIHDLHRDPRYWDEPHKVKPERFLPENVKGRDSNAFVPFSLGAMDCLGRVYATALIKTLIVQLLRRLQFEGEGSLDDLQLDVAISVRSAIGYMVRTKPRGL